MRAIVHEMRNHLAVAVANIEAFLDGKLEPTDARLRAVLQALNELDVLMNDLRPGSAPAAMPSRFEMIDVCRLIANEATAMEAAAEEKGIRFSVLRCERAHAACENFIGDPVRIGQILKNIMFNAIRYTPPGRSIAVDCHREAGELAFTVSDEGPGIDGDDEEHIFEPGFRGKASAWSQGSGLGLAVVKTFVEEHGGSIALASGTDGGAVFTVRLPGVARAGASCAACGPSADADAASGLHDVASAPSRPLHTT